MANIALVEVFRSVQGEGYNAGRPAIFVRFAGCNLSCVFADGSVCDTPYQQAKIKTDLDELFAEYILPLTIPNKLPEPELGEDWRPPSGPRRDERRLMLILTGGEPTLAPQFDAVAKEASRLGFYVAVETNGTRWREGLLWCDWVTVSPKVSIHQGSPAPLHNPHPASPALHAQVVRLLDVEKSRPSGEYRYVIGGADTPAPPHTAAFRHYVSPAVLSDGLGMEWQQGFPGFVPGALKRCLEIVQDDPRWRVSVQQHKQWQVR